MVIAIFTIIRATTVNNIMMRLISAISFVEGGTPQPHRVNHSGQVLDTLAQLGVS